MADLGKKLGHMPCPEHAAEKLLVRENERGTLSARCDECDATHYAKKGTGQHASWLKKITKLPEGAPAPAPAPKPAAKGGGILDL